MKILRFKLPLDPLPDYFYIDMSINESELNGLCESYLCTQHKLSKPILQLLNAVNDFIAGSDPAYAKIRESTMTDEELIAGINSLSNSFKLFIEVKNSLKSNSKEYQIMDKAVDFCLKLVDQQFEKLKDITEDRIYGLYDSNESFLKSIIINHH